LQLILKVTQSRKMHSDELLDILGNSTRREIIRLVSQKPRCLSELSRETGVEKMALSRHLDYMTRANILTVEEERNRRGRPRKYYEIADTITLRVSISPTEFSTRLSRRSSRSGASELAGGLAKHALRIRDPVSRLSALSEIAQELIREREYHEECLERVEDLLEEVRALKSQTMSELDLYGSEEPLLLRLTSSQSGER